MAAEAEASALVASGTMANASDHGEDCGHPADVYAYRFWSDGVLVSVVALVGLVGNVLALIVLSRPKLRDVFHQLLFALACFDILYIVCGAINYTFWAFEAQSDIFTYLYPYLIYPLTHVAVAGTIFMTVAISIERYLGLCHPMMPPHSRKAWFYVVPVLAVSLALNVPKWMEVELEIQTVNGTEVPFLKNTQLRFSEDYIRGYIMWTRLFSTGVIPVTLLLFLNSRIVVDLCSSKVQRFGSARRQRKEINLCVLLLSIVLVFFTFHAMRIVMDVYEFANTEKVIRCKPFWPDFWAQALIYVSHLLMMINSSANFVIYCLVGHTFRRELCRTLGLRRYRAVRHRMGSTTNAGGSKNNNDSMLGNGNGNGVPQRSVGGATYDSVAKEDADDGIAATVMVENRHGIAKAL